MRTIIGERIRAARRARNMTQVALAHRLGVIPQTIIRIEAGQYPRFDQAIDIAKILDVDLDYLAGLQSAFHVERNVIPGIQYAQTLLDNTLAEIQSQTKGA